LNARSSTGGKTPGEGRDRISGVSLLLFRCFWAGERKTKTLGENNVLERWFNAVKRRRGKRVRNFF